MSYEIEQRNIRFVEALYAATAAGDWATAATMVTDDFCVVEAGTLPFAGVHRGIKGLQELYAFVIGSGCVAGLEISQYTAGGDRVVALVDMLLVGTPPVRVALAETFRLRDGKVSEIKPYYFDTRPISEAFAARANAKP